MVEQSVLVAVAEGTADLPDRAADLRPGAEGMPGVHALEHADGRPPMVASLSPSSMATWRQCPKRFFFEKILRLDVEPSEPAVCGSFVHLVLEHLMAAPPGHRTADEARRIAGELWAPFCTDPDSRFAELALDDVATRAFKQRAWAGIAGYFQIEDPNRVTVIGTEQEVRADLGGAPVYGIIDRVDLGTDGLVVTDYKSGKAPAWKDEREEKLGQLRTYAALLEATGQRVTELRLLFVSPQLSAAARADRCVQAAAAAEEAVVAAAGCGWQEAMQAIGEVAAAASAARAAAVARADGDDAGRAGARAAAAEAAAAAAMCAAEQLCGAQAAAPDEVAALLVEATDARRRAFFAQRSLADARPTTVTLRLRDADLELARAEAQAIWAEATACYDAWDFPAQTGALCDWCPFADRCDAFAAWDAAGRPSAERTVA
ncbi:MAG TPA: PD-(D/E)XK nuclease family protein [Acidimicrobiales bacterium]|nr:PD-(D/E)XK nuclease family protein [Acidimicrobiales bacterium]